VSRLCGVLLWVFCCAVLSACAADKAVSTSSAAKTEMFSSMPLTASEQSDIRNQIERNWNLGDLAGSPNVAGMVVELRAKLSPDGTVTEVTLMNDQPGNPDFPHVAESARRAVMISSPLKLPPGKSYPSMVLRFRPDQVVQ
jgi:hypothetical protein